MRRAIQDFGFWIADCASGSRTRTWVRSPNPKSKIQNSKSRRRASVLLLVLVVIAVLALGTNTYLDLMQTEHRAVRRHGRAAQSLRLAESGAEYLKIILARTPAQIQTLGGLTSNTTAMQAQLADNQADVYSRGRFTILCPAQVNGLYSGVRYGLENESAKLNLNALFAEGADGEAQNRLLVLPGMTPEVADAILDWLDSDATPRQVGAEAEYYAGLDPPYLPRNGPINGLDELLLVRGVTPELLYGLDQNRNYFVDAGETPRGAMTEIDNAEGAMNRGWSAYLTLDSVEALGGSAAAPMTDVNSGDLNTLYNTLKTSLSDDQAKFIILYRQYGQPPAGGAGQPGQPGGGQPVGGTTGGAGTIRQPGQPGQPGAGGANAAGGAAVPLSSITLNMQQQGGTQITSLLDLIGAQVQVPQTPPGGEQAGGNGGSGNNNGGGGGGGGNTGDGGGGGDDGGGGGGGSGGGNNSGGNGGPGGGNQQGGDGQNQPPPQTVASPWQENANGYRDLMKLADIASVVNQGRVAGRVNINAAPRPVLLTIPFLPQSAVEQIIAQRELEPNLALSEQRHALWLLTTGILQLPQMRQVERFITTRGDAFSGQSVGFFEGDPTPVRAEFILDRSVGAPRLRLWRDMTAWGPGFSPQLLGVPQEATQ